MSAANGKQENGSSSARNNGLGPVAREKYEAILQARVRRCVAVQEAMIKARRSDALGIFLEKNGLVGKIATYRASLEELIGFFGEPDWRNPAWLRDDSALRNHPKVEKGINAILREMPDLKDAFAELDRLHHFEEQVTEKVWLAGAPEEIAELLQEIGEPPAHADSGNDGAESGN